MENIENTLVNPQLFHLSCTVDLALSIITVNETQLSLQEIEKSLGFTILHVYNLLLSQLNGAIKMGYGEQAQAIAEEPTRKLHALILGEHIK